MRMTFSIFMGIFHQHVCWGEGERNGCFFFSENIGKFVAFTKCLNHFIISNKISIWSRTCGGEISSSCMHISLFMHYKIIFDQVEMHVVNFMTLFELLNWEIHLSSFKFDLKSEQLPDNDVLTKSEYILEVQR